MTSFLLLCLYLFCKRYVYWLQILFNYSSFRFGLSGYLLNVYSLVFVGFCT